MRHLIHIHSPPFYFYEILVDSTTIKRITRHTIHAGIPRDIPFEDLDGETQDKIINAVLKQNE